MFSELTPLLFVFASLAMRLQNRSYIGYESWSQVHAFREDLSCVVCYFGKKHRSDSDTGKGICLLISFCTRKPLSRMLNKAFSKVKDSMLILL
jgi:hypothetical protein